MPFGGTGDAGHVGELAFQARLEEKRNHDDHAFGRRPRRVGRGFVQEALPLLLPSLADGGMGEGVELFPQAGVLENQVSQDAPIDRLVGM